MRAAPPLPPAPPAALPPERAEVFFDGIFSEPRLSHPEAVAVGPDGWIWAGNQDGDICRIAPDGGRIDKVASTGGFALGLAFDGDRALFMCDLRHAAVFRLDLCTRRLTRFAEGPRIPNYPLVDRARGRLMVSDSHDAERPGPGIWAFDLATGAGAVWDGRDYDFANGLAMRDGEDAIYLCETFAAAIRRIEIRPDGSAGAAEIYATGLPGLPDGIAFDAEGGLIVGCYEPSHILRVPPGGGAAETVIADPTAHRLCHPTNIAFDGAALFAANLGRWHVTRIEMAVGAEPLWKQSL
ncbi:SMP-30/gluconolactonase/LRE family protein [Limimaricola pyoseonensis]|uniref:Sugar lactone lactonase YvrE n=1 Tax=Limimaricola pyoseonensis TaxID=521013 RepID=A0A1G7HRY7_9RHOB|nr:SMP-30/gluconolactonase/LRE family protein [Limimaricola pyoseonensis]SDF03182.1 Sugar lactone lactonase YvrE [Limimaricola pyoseonensis]